MARIRTIKPEFFRSPSVAHTSPWARLLFIAMWCWADDHGRAEWTPRELLGFAFPHDTEAPCNDAEFPRLLTEVACNFSVEFYTVGERRFYAITSWEDHQRNERRAKSRFPSPDDPEVAPDKEIHASSGNAVQLHGSSVQTDGKTSAGTGEHRNIGTGEEDLAQTGVAVLSDRSTPTYPAAFETFWAIYPIKRGKGKALKAWQRAVKRSSPDAINAGAQRYKDDPNRDDGYTKYAEGWLNADGWLDEALPIRGNDKQSRVNSIVASAIERGNRGENIYAGLIEGNNS